MNVETRTTYVKGPPRIAVKTSLGQAYADLAQSVKNDEVLSAQVVEVEGYTDRLERPCLKVTPIISFSRSGTQEFAEGALEAWWDRRY